MYRSCIKMVKFVDHLAFINAYKAMAPKREAIKKERAALKARMKGRKKALTEEGAMEK